MKPSGQLIEFLNRTPLPWVRYDEAKQKLIVVIDNHMLSTYRNCAQHFFYSNVQGYQKKSGVKEGEKERAWLWNTDRTSVIPDHCPKELTLKWLRTLELLDMQLKNKPVEELVYLKLGME